MNKILALALVCLCLQNYAQEKLKWTSERADGHAPITIMGDHYHNKGEIMFSYRFMFMDMEGLLQEHYKTSNSQVHDQKYMVTPLKMPMTMHMFGGMYGISDNITLLGMLMFKENEMNLQMRMPNGMIKTFETTSSGISDIKLGALVKIFNQNQQSLHGQFNVSLPTGSIEQKDETPMSQPNKVQLPYPMQIGSGSFDTEIAITYLGQNNSVSWGTQLKTTLRLNKNKYDYKLGNHLDLNIWGAYPINEWLSLSGRFEGTIVEKIKGTNPNLNPMMVTTADTNNSGGEYINSGLGCNFYVPKGELKNLRIGVEYAYPIYQRPNGIQLQKNETITFGVQYAL